MISSCVFGQDFSYLHTQKLVQIVPLRFQTFFLFWDFFIQKIRKTVKKIIACFSLFLYLKAPETRKCQNKKILKQEKSISTRYRVCKYPKAGINTQQFPSIKKTNPFRWFFQQKNSLFFTLSSIFINNLVLNI